MKKDGTVAVAFHGGERGIRTLDELPHTAFRERPVQPLLHLSVLLVFSQI